MVMEEYKEDIYFPNIYLFLTLKSCEEPGGTCHMPSWKTMYFLKNQITQKSCENFLIRL